MQLFRGTILNTLNNTYRWRRAIFFILFSLLFTLASQARSVFSRYEKDKTFQILVGGYVQNNIRVNNQVKYYNTDPVRAFFPYVRIKYNAFSITPDAVRLVITKSLLFKFDLRLSYKGHAYETDGMAKRRNSIFGGVGMRILMLKLEALKDLSGFSNSAIYSAAIVIPIPLGKYGIITLQAEIEYWEGKYVDYYFGVREDEVTPTRPYYKGSWASDYNFKIEGQFFLSPHWIMRITPAFRYYDQTIFDSPTVTKRREYSVLAGFGYQF